MSGKTTGSGLRDTSATLFRWLHDAPLRALPRIAVARHNYIDAVRLYNTELRTFPRSVWASIFYTHNKPMEDFAIADSTKAPPQVQFN